MTANKLFDPRMVEKSTRLLSFLDTLATHPMAKGKLSLHGGTALNLFVLKKLTRLSLDADINYIGESKEELERDREIVESAIKDVGRMLGYRVEAPNGSHAGLTMKFVYDSSVTGRRGFIKVDLDYMNRVPLLPPIMRDATVGNVQASFLVNAPVEVVAGKVKAIMSRCVPRDLYDIGQAAGEIEAWTTGDEELDHAIIYYHRVMTASFPKEVDVLGRFEMRQQEIEDNLWTVLPDGERPEYEELAERARDFIEWASSPQTIGEKDFSDNFAKGVFAPECLFEKWPDVLERANRDPGAKWKLMNLAKMLGL